MNLEGQKHEELRSCWLKTSFFLHPPTVHTDHRSHDSNRPNGVRLALAAYTPPAARFEVSMNSALVCSSDKRRCSLETPTQHKRREGAESTRSRSSVFTDHRVSCGRWLSRRDPKMSIEHDKRAFFCETHIATGHCGQRRRRHVLQPASSYTKLSATVDCREEYETTDLQEHKRNKRKSTRIQKDDDQQADDESTNCSASAKSQKLG